MLKLISNDAWNVVLMCALLAPGFTAVGSDREHATPTASFSANTVCQGLPTVFTNNSSTLSGTIVASLWDFGDGQGSTVFSPQHIYANSGVFSVTLTVINSNGDVDDHTDVIMVHPSGNLNFLITSSSNCESANFTFTNLSNIVSGGFTDTEWTFGDNTQSTGTNASHTFSSHGNYTITLTTLTDQNCTSSVSKSLDVYPEAEVDFNFEDDCTDQEIRFSNTTTVPSGLVSYNWKFDDGTISKEINPAHLFSVAGTYEVTLQATTEKGCTTSAAREVTTHPVPVAAFTASASCFGSATVFINESTLATGSNQYSWSFGDGSTSTGTSPAHTYGAVGNFGVTLVAISDHGCTSTTSAFSYVSPKPVVNFSSTDVCLGEEAEFINSTAVAEGALTYTWTFGDGQSSNALNPLHIYENTGTFNVTLTAEASQGSCNSTLTQPVSVFNQPKAFFEVPDVCEGEPSVFVNQSTGLSPDVAYVWDFGNGTLAHEPGASILYTASQTYTVSLTVSTPAGCSDSHTKPVRINPRPQPSFVVANSCLGDPSAFNNFTTVASGGLTYHWSFGDAAFSTDREPDHKYSVAGIYEISLTATTAEGCVSETKKSVTVYPLPIVDFHAPSVCDGTPMAFENLSSVSVGEISELRWDFGDQTTSLIDDPTKQFLNDGAYSVTLIATTDKGCQAVARKTVTVHPSAIASFSVQDVCVDQPVQVVNSSTSEDGNLSYTWHFGDGTQSNATAPSHQYATHGVYTIRLHASSDQGCADEFSRAVAVFALPEINAGPDQVISKGYRAHLTASGASTYTWQPIDGLDNSASPSPEASPSVTTQYMVVGRDSFGCANSDSVTVTVNEDFLLVASNVMTPDGNGKNDTWVVSNIEAYGDAFVRVYDRWGKMVFRQEAYRNDWSGLSGSDVLPDGTYYYYITFQRSDLVYKGALTILRSGRD